jgi:iron complex outermembrane receptor protein
MTDRLTKNRKTMLLSGAAFALCILPAAAQAQDAAAGDATSSEPGDIVVTARKSNESILDVPLSVSAVTADQIEKRGITSINDIARFTPSINVNSNSASRNDRSAQQLIIRGFTPSAFTNPTASLFIDGVPVSSSSAITIISSPERVEVLKGPQSAYFGRNTFAGAVNVVNKTPGTEFAGAIGATAGTRELYRLHGEVEGPIFGDWLRFRITGDRFNKGGSYTNRFNPTEKLGDQRTDSGTLTLYAEPTPELKFKAFGLFSEDNDGPSAQALMSAVEVRDAAGNIVVANQSNCTLNGLTAAGAPRQNPWFCGVTPKIDWARQPSSNNLEDQYTKNFLANPSGRLVSPKDGVKGYGLKRQYYHLHLVADWEVGGGVTLSSLTGYNNEFYSQLADIDNYGSSLIPNTPANVAAGARPYFDYPFYVERKYKDWSQELRASYDDGGPFTGTVGVSYLRAWQVGGLGGGNVVLGSPARPASPGVAAIGTGLSVPSGATKSRTFGAFFGLTYKPADGFSISAEGRYQIDKLYAYAAPQGFNAVNDAFLPRGFYAGGSQLVQKDYKNFLPRLIAQYDIAQDMMVYASWSKGVNPGTFNTAFLSFTEAQVQAAADLGLSIAVDPEKVTNYEVGLKGRLLDRKLTFTLAAYYAPWRNQINPVTFNFVNGAALQILRASANSGSVDMKGVELEGNLALGRIDINFGASFNDSDINSFTNATVTQLTGVTDFKGNHNEDAARYSANAGIQYTGQAGSSEWFVRGDWSFKSGIYATQANELRTPASHFFNGRTGIDIGNLSLSAFVNNIFNTKTPVSIDYGNTLTPDFRFSQYSSRVLLGLPDLRTMGVEAKVKF